MRASQGRVYDVSRPLRSGGVVYPGDPAISFQVHSSLARGDAANVTSLRLSSHSGTHVDAPSHFLQGGTAVDRLPLERLIGPAVVLDLPADLTTASAADLARHDLRGHSRVLLRTRNSAIPVDAPFREDYCALALDAAEYLVDRGVELIGIDALSIEPFGSEEFPVHHLLLERGIVILEGLDLSAVSAGVYRLVCLPLRLEGLDGAPARTVLIE